VRSTACAAPADAAGARPAHRFGAAVTQAWPRSASSRCAAGRARRAARDARLRRLPHVQLDPLPRR
jgi:hypothetical protein